MTTKTETKTAYLLVNSKTKLPACLEVESNEGGEFCCSAQHSLVSFDEDLNVAEFSSVDEAEYARCHDTGWYNAGPNTPSHGYGYNQDEYYVCKRVSVCSYTDTQVQF